MFINNDDILLSNHAKTLAPLVHQSSHYDWQYIVSVAREHRRELILGNIIAILATICSVPVPLLLPLLVDEVLLNRPGWVTNTIDSLTPATWQGAHLYILTILMLTVLLRFSALIFNVWQSKQFSLISKDIIFRMRHALLSRLEKVSMSEYETLGSGTVASYLVTDMEIVDQFVGNTVSRLLVAVLTIIGVTAVLLWIHWQLALLILLMNPIVIFFTMKCGKHVKDLKNRENAAFSIFQQSLTETLDAIHQIRASNRERHYMMRIIEQARKVKEHGILFAWKSDAANRLSFVIFLFGFDIFRAIAMMMVLFSGLSIGQMFAIFGYLWFMMAPVQEILNIQYSWYAAKAALGRINHLLTLHLEPHYICNKNPFLNKTTSSIKIEDVHFSYSDHENILKGINLNIQAGETVALIGATGGGKSTLVEVLIGLYTPNKGMIYYDDVPITKIGLEIVRENVATVLQHPALLNDTIRANLTLGRDIGDMDLWYALEISQLKNTVENMKLQLGTVVGRQGIRLSGGQRQRLAIARMILNDPKVIILDEATSALDAETEYRLYAALNDFLKERTTLIIAHRLSAIKQATRVYVFEAGIISAQGSHNDLLSQNGLYKKLYGIHQFFANR